MAGRERVVVAGGGVGGLAAALALGRAGHRVTVLERDPLPVHAGPEEAFAAERPGAPQAHQTHGFLARVVAVLNERFPDVLADLRAAGCTVLPPAMELGEPRPGDEDLAVLITRRTTFEWVLRRAALAEPGVEVRTGAWAAGHRRSTACGSTAAGAWPRTWSSPPPAGGARCPPGWPTSAPPSTRPCARAASST